MYNFNMILKNFIVFEGIDGAGTSTQIKLLAKKNPQKIIPTAEPTSKETGLFLRRMLGGEFTVDEKTNAFLFAADRCEHLYGKDGIINTINQNKIVVSDRYFFSSLAYQSISCSNDFPKFLNSKFPLPEYLFYFKIDPNISLKRVNARNNTKEIYEKLDLQIKIANEYDKIISEYQNSNTEMKIITIDATKSIKQIETEIYDIIKNII